MQTTVKLNMNLIIDEYSNYIFKIVNNIVGSSLPYQDKEEIVSDCFYLLWKHQENIKSNLKSYLATIAKNLAYEKLRNKKLELNYDDYETSRVELSLEERIIMKEKLSRLTENELQIFHFYYVDGLKIKEIAKISNKTISNIKIQLYRLRKKLKEDFYEKN